MNDQTTLARGWLRKAESDLVAAERIVVGPGPYDTACFHAQQAIEKTLKGFLAFHGEPIPRSHDLEELAQLCQQHEPLPQLRLAELAEATDNAVRIRYDLEAWPTQNEARQLLEPSQHVREIILAVLPREVHP